MEQERCQSLENGSRCELNRGHTGNHIRGVFSWNDFDADPQQERCQSRKNGWQCKYPTHHEDMHGACGVNSPWVHWSDAQADPVPPRCPSRHEGWMCDQAEGHEGLHTHRDGFGDDGLVWANENAERKRCPSTGYGRDCERPAGHSGLHSSDLWNWSDIDDGPATPEAVSEDEKQILNLTDALKVAGSKIREMEEELGKKSIALNDFEQACKLELDRNTSLEEKLRGTQSGPEVPVPGSRDAFEYKPRKPVNVVEEPGSREVILALEKRIEQLKEALAVAGDRIHELQVDPFYDEEPALRLNEDDVKRAMEVAMLPNIEVGYRQWAVILEAAAQFARLAGEMTEGTQG